MATIKTTFGKGTLNSDASPPIATVIRDIADDIAGTSAASPVTANSAVTAVVNATDLASALTLVNDIKAKYNAAVALINELKTNMVAARAYTVKTVKG